ncbi:unnamed protein product [Somion occarium]|uniref:BTB domain-containing protein n=1 Tax=Somion occarium TaxID=3059160 RepID=A0ABP1DXN5_9APHY
MNSSMYSPYGSSYRPAFTSPTSAVQGGTAVEKVKRHPQYYLQGGDIHFLVEHFLFRVHRYFFERESAVFREKLATPAAAGQPPKGSSDTNPYPLEDVRADDFSRFLWVFYNPKYSLYDADLDDWSVILKLAFDWRFSEVKKLACRELEKISIEPVTKIKLYQDYELDRKLLIPSYLFLTQREEPLTLHEGRQLGLETALLIATARECARGKPSVNGTHSPSAAKIPNEDLEDIIRRVFGLSGGPPSPSLSPVAVVGNQPAPSASAAARTASIAASSVTSGAATPAGSKSTKTTTRGTKTPSTPRSASPAPSSKNLGSSTSSENKKDEDTTSTAPVDDLLGGPLTTAGQPPVDQGTAAGGEGASAPTGQDLLGMPRKTRQRLTLTLPGLASPQLLEMSSPMTPLALMLEQEEQEEQREKHNLTPQQLTRQHPGHHREKGRTGEARVEAEVPPEQSNSYEVNVHVPDVHDEHTSHRTSSLSPSDLSMTIAGTELDDGTTDAGDTSTVVEDFNVHDMLSQGDAPVHVKCEQGTRFKEPIQHEVEGNSGQVALQQGNSDSAQEADVTEALEDYPDTTLSISHEIQTTEHDTKNDEESTVVKTADTHSNGDEWDMIEPEEADVTDASEEHKEDVEVGQESDNCEGDAKDLTGNDQPDESFPEQNVVDPTENIQLDHERGNEPDVAVTRIPDVLPVDTSCHDVPAVMVTEGAEAQKDSEAEPVSEVTPAISETLQNAVDAASQDDQIQTNQTREFIDSAPESTSDSVANESDGTVVTKSSLQADGPSGEETSEAGRELFSTAVNDKSVIEIHDASRTKEVDNVSSDAAEQLAEKSNTKVLFAVKLEITDEPAEKDSALEVPTNGAVQTLDAMAPELGIDGGEQQKDGSNDDLHGGSPKKIGLEAVDEGTIKEVQAEQQQSQSVTES